MLKQYTFLALALIGCAMLVLERDANGFAPAFAPHIVRVSVHRQACSRTVYGPTASRASVLATVRAAELRCRIAMLQARMQASIARLQAEKACWLGSLNQNVHGRPSARTSPAWRDVQYDAQQLAKIFGFCKQEPV